MQSVKPSKQRKMVFQAPDHVRYKLFAAPLADDLIASQGAKTLPVRSGDMVRIQRGDHKGFEGKVTRVDREKYRVYVEGLTREKVDGTAIFVPIHPSKIVITRLNLDDKWRKKILERKRAAPEKPEKAEKKPKKKAEEAKVVEEKAPAEEKPEEKKPKRKRKTTKKPAAKKAQEEETEEAAKEEKPKRRARAKRKTAGKTEGEE